MPRRRRHVASNRQSPAVESRNPAMLDDRFDRASLHQRRDSGAASSRRSGPRCAERRTLRLRAWRVGVDAPRPASRRRRCAPAVDRGHWRSWRQVAPVGRCRTPCTGGVGRRQSMLCAVVGAPGRAGRPRPTARAVPPRPRPDRDHRAKTKTQARPLPAKKSSVHHCVTMRASTRAATPRSWCPGSGTDWRLATGEYRALAHAKEPKNAALGEGPSFLLTLLPRRHGCLSRGGLRAFEGSNLRLFSALAAARKDVAVARWIVDNCRSAKRPVERGTNG